MTEENPFRERLSEFRRSETSFAEYGRGRERVKQVLAYLVLLMFLAFVFRLFLIGMEGALPRVVRFGIAAALAWFAFDGRAWARWLLVALLGLTCVIDFVVAAALVSRGEWDALAPVITFFIAYAVVLYYLAFDQLSNGYFQHRRELRREGL